MPDDSSGHGAPTRRDTLKYSGAVVGGGMLAGCISDSTPDDTETTDSRYSATMAPMGEVEFESVPETWMAYFSTYGDMGIALGQLDGLQGLIYTENWPLAFFEHLPDVDVSFDGVTQLMGDSGIAKEVFQEHERYEALKTVHKDLLSKVQSNLPDKEERPTVGLLSINSDFEEGSFYAYPVNNGNGHKQYRDVEMRGAFDEVIEGGFGKWDYEQILEVDPDALLFQYGFSHVTTEEFERRMDAMREDPVGQQLTAVQNDRLYRGGTSYQGPLINLFQTEAAAKQFYPDAFGEWNGIETLANPEDRLFDYQHVADIINGDI